MIAYIYDIYIHTYNISKVIITDCNRSSNALKNMPSKFDGLGK